MNGFLQIKLFYTFSESVEIIKIYVNNILFLE